MPPPTPHPASKTGSQNPEETSEIGVATKTMETDGEVITVTTTTEEVITMVTGEITVDTGKITVVTENMAGMGTTKVVTMTTGVMEDTETGIKDDGRKMKIVRTWCYLFDPACQCVHLMIRLGGQKLSEMNCNKWFSNVDLNNVHIWGSVALFTKNLTIKMKISKYNNSIIILHPSIFE